MLRKYNNEKNLPRCYKKHWYLISGHSRIVSCKRVTSKYVKFFGNATEKVCLLLIFEVAFFISFCWVCATMKFLCFMLAGMLCMHYVLLWVSWTWNDTFFSYWFFFVLFFFVSIWNFAFAFVFTGHVWLLSRLQGVADSSKDAHFNISIWLNYLMDYRPSPDWTVERNKLNLITKGDTNWHLL